MFNSDFDTFVFSEMEHDAEEGQRGEKEKSSYDRWSHEDDETGGKDEDY